MVSSQEEWFCLRLTVGRPAAPKLAKWLMERGIAGVEERSRPEGTELLAYSQCQAELETLVQELERHFGESAGIHTRVVEALADESWSTAWTLNLKSERLGDGYLLVPTHEDPAAEVSEMRRVVHYSPDLAFGDGAHPTTRLAAAAVERTCRGRTGCTVLDVGTGNGVLSFIAHFSGAAFVLGLDTDGRALEAARRNARLNRVPEGACRFVGDPLSTMTTLFDVLIANLEIRVLLEVLPQMLPRIRTDGEGILTGFLASAGDLVERRLAELGARIGTRRELEGWAIFGVNPPVSPAGSSSVGARNQSC